MITFFRTLLCSTSCRKPSTTPVGVSRPFDFCPILGIRTRTTQIYNCSSTLTNRAANTMWPCDWLRSTKICHLTFPPRLINTIWYDMIWMRLSTSYVEFSAMPSHRSSVQHACLSVCLFRLLVCYWINRLRIKAWSTAARTVNRYTIKGVLKSARSYRESFSEMNEWIVLWSFPLDERLPYGHTVPAVMPSCEYIHREAVILCKRWVLSVASLCRTCSSFASL